jgi:hypothetical protein
MFHIVCEETHDIQPHQTAHPPVYANFGEVSPFEYFASSSMLKNECSRASNQIFNLLLLLKTLILFRAISKAKVYHQVPPNHRSYYLRLSSLHMVQTIVVKIFKSYYVGCVSYYRRQEPNLLQRSSLDEVDVICRSPCSSILRPLAML